MNLNLRILTLSCCTWLAVAAQADVTLNPIADTRILSIFPTSNFGADTIISSYNIGPSNDQNSLLQFDYSSLAGLTIASATLRLNGEAFDGSTSTTTTSIFRPTMAWSEMQATWKAASTGNPWTNPGGDFVGTTGVQNSNPFATITGPMSGTTPTWYEFDVTSLVTGQVGGTWANDGMMVTGVLNNTLVFNSKESGNPSFFPQLVIKTSTVPEPGTLLVVAVLSGLLVRRPRRK